MNIIINGYKVAYFHNQLKSDDYPFVFLHGMGADFNMWEEQISYFKERREILAISLQGHGNSDGMPQSSDYSIQSYTRTVLKIMDKLNIKKAIIIGNSMGGVIGYNMLSKYTEVVAMLITHGTTPRLKYGRFSLKILSAVDALLLTLMGVDGMMKFLSKNVTKDTSIAKKIYKIMRRADPKMIPPTRRAIANYDFTNVFNLNVPVVIIKGELDKGINREIEKYYPLITQSKNCKIVDFNQGGHILNMEFPQKYNQLIQSLVSSVDVIK